MSSLLLLDELIFTFSHNMNEQNNDINMKLDVFSNNQNKYEKQYLLHQTNIYKCKETTGCDVLQCESLKVIRSLLKRYSLYMLNIDSNDSKLSNHIETIYNADYDNVCLLNDYNHLLFEHPNEFENIYNVLTAQCNGNKTCQLEGCKMMQRNQRNRSNITNDESLLKGIYYDCDNIVMLQLLDTIHCNYLHSFDIGFKLMCSEKQFIIDHDNDDIKTNDTVNSAYDINVANITHIINTKRKSYLNIKGFERLTSNTNKFMMQQSSQECELSTFSFGYRFFYWEHYKNNQTIYDNAHGSASDKYKWTENPPISNANATLADWYISKKYDNFKKELLTNKIQCIGQQQWQNLIKKAAVHIKTNKVRGMKCPRTASAAYYEMTTDITQGMTENHLIAMMVYCGYDVLQCKFTETFRKIDVSETDEMLKQRHRNYYHFGRLLRECVECFGTNTPTTADQKRYLHHVTVYQGIRGNFTYSSMWAYIKGPLSTTTDFAVALNFCENGMIVSMNVLCSGLMLQTVDEYEAGTAHKMCCMDMSWISNYSNEAEIFFIGGLNELTFNTIIKAPNTNYHFYIKGIKQITYLFKTLSKFQEEPPTTKDEIKMAFRLLAHELHRTYPNHPYAQEFDGCPEYIKTLLHLHCLSIRFLHFTASSGESLYKRQQSKVHDSLFKYENGWIKLHVLMALFPNVTRIDFRPADKTIMEQVVIYDSVLKFINNQTTPLRMIRFDLENIDKMGENRISRQVDLYTNNFTKKNWNIAMDVDDDLYGLGSIADCPMQPIRSVAVVMCCNNL